MKSSPVGHLIFIYVLKWSCCAIQFLLGSVKTVLRTWLWLEQSLLLIMCNWKQENMRNEDTGRCIVMNLPEMLKFPNIPTHFSLVVSASVSTQGVTQWSTRVLLSCFRHGWEKKGVLLYCCGQIWVGRQGKKKGKEDNKCLFKNCR